MLLCLDHALDVIMNTLLRVIHVLCAPATEVGVKDYGIEMEYDAQLHKVHA